MNGYGMPGHRARRARTPLFVRTLVIRQGPTDAPLIVCLADLAMITHALRSGAVDALAKHFESTDQRFDEDRLVVTCTHSHSVPGGCGHEALYNLVTPGFQPDHVRAVINAIVNSVTTALATAAESELTIGRGAFTIDDEVAWNRSITAYNRNPEVAHLATTQTHLGLDREMTVLQVRRDGDLRALMALFGVHATCLGNHLDAHDGDNKGYAATHAEAAMAEGGHIDTVALFAQATAGDVSPHFHGPGQRRRRREVRDSGDDLYARHNGVLQADLALEISADPVRRPLDGPIDAVMTFVDFTDVEVHPQFVGGIHGARTSDPCLGAAFFVGTPVDGLGAPKTLGWVARALARQLRRRRLSRPATQTAADRRYYRDLYASQGAKDIVMEAGPKLNVGRPLAKTMLPDFVDPSVAQMKREARTGAIDHSPLLATVLPVQIVRIGSLAMACCPGEFTTVAGRRVRETLTELLGPLGVDEVLILTYSNDYMGYVTTAEEYQIQNYEGGNTIFGQWTLGAFQTAFADLASQLQRPADQRNHDRATRPPAVPADELAKRTALPPR